MSLEDGNSEAGRVDITEEPVGTKYTVYISGVMGAPEEYIEAIHAMDRATVNDQIFIHINSEGGRIDGAVEFITAMERTLAETTARTSALCMSAATLILLKADNIIVGDHCNFMIHNYSSGASGSGSLVRTRVEATQSWVENIMREAYGPIMTEDELNAVFEDDKERYFLGSEIKERIAASAQYSEKLVKGN